RTPQAFYEQMIAAKPDPTTGKPDEAKKEEFLARHPETARVFKELPSHPFSSGFEDSTFYGLNAFRFTNAAGESTPVRWMLTPEQPVKAAGAPGDKEYLFRGLIEQIHRGPLRWRLSVIVGKPGDPTDDATVAWPKDRERVDVGTLTL